VFAGRFMIQTSMASPRIGCRRTPRRPSTISSRVPAPMRKLGCNSQRWLPATVVCVVNVPVGDGPILLGGNQQKSEISSSNESSSWA